MLSIPQFKKKRHLVNMAVKSEFLVKILFTNSILSIWPGTNNSLSCAHIKTLEINYKLHFNFLIVWKTVYTAILSTCGEQERDPII